ncbi:MAG: porin [Burkholderiales bacterium]|nr:porin [Burkholderiales bacterium]
MGNLKAFGIAVGLAGTSLAASAQSSVTLYGSIDQYVNYMRSSSGATVKSLEDGALLRSRIGLRGVEDLGDGLAAKFQLEGGLSADNGTQADSSRFFDRQSWVGLSNPYGEIRLGRQNGPILVRGGYIDYTTRTLGSMINNFGVPSRFDNDFSYISPRVGGVAFEGHVSLPESPVGNHPLVYQAALDYVSKNYVVGYMGVRGRPPTNAAVPKDVVYDNVYANWLYGKGTVYLAFVRSNNSTSTAVSNNAGTILGNVGGYNAGTNPDLNNFYNIYQVSADYQLTELLRVGALWGKIDDKSGRDRGASGGSMGAYYALSKRTTLLALVDTLRNATNGGWRPSGSAGLKTTFTAPNDINGRTINGVQFGILHRF